MKKQKPKLSVIILSWNTRELLKNCLESVVGSQGALVTSHRSPITEVVVVDNGSTDGSVEMVKEMVARGQLSVISDQGLDVGGKNVHRSPVTPLRLVENQANLGFAKGNNVGINLAKGEYLMLLNSDTLVGRRETEKLVNFLDNHPDVDIIGPKLLNSDGSPQASCGCFPDLKVTFIMLFKEHFGGSDYVRSSPKTSVFVDWLVGAAFVARKKVFDKIGGFDEKIFMYMEEVEWFYRANKAGFKAFFYKDAEITHLSRGSSKTGRKDPILNIYKGVIYFFRKHKSPVELVLVKTMLKLKAVGALTIGYLGGNQYLKETYGEALKIN